MKLIGLCGTLAILLICNPEAHCHLFSIAAARDNQEMLMKLGKKITAVQNTVAKQNLVINNQLPDINNEVAQLSQRLANCEASVESSMSQMMSISTQLKETERIFSAMKTSIESVSATVTTNVAAIRASTDKINKQLDNTDQKLNNAQKQHELNFSKDSMRNECLSIAEEDNLAEHQISETDKLLKKYDEKLSTYDVTADRATNNFNELYRRLSLIRYHCYIKFNDMKHQVGELKNIRLLLSEADNTLKELPSRSDSLYALHNVTLDSIGRIGHDITEVKKNYFTKLTNQLIDVKNSLEVTNGIIQNFNQTTTMSDKAYKDIMANFNKLHLEIQAMSNKESMILQTASKIDIAQESEFREIKDLIKEKTQNFNNKLNNSITVAQPLIGDNQVTTLVEIANKIKSEMECLSSDIVDIYEMTVEKVPFDQK